MRRASNRKSIEELLKKYGNGVKKKVWVLIPAHNEEKTIGKVIKEIRKALSGKFYYQILVIDDGSTDKTREKALSSGAMVLTHPKNFGKGTALRNGWLWLMWNNHLRGDEIICHIDADGQHDPRFIPLLIDVLERYDYDMVIGRRDMSVYPFHKRIGNLALSFLATALTGQWIEDSESGMRVFYAYMLEDLYKIINAQSYEIEIEMNIVAGKLGYKIGFAEIKVPKYRKGIGVIGGIKNAWAAVKTWLKIKTGWLKL